MRIYITNAIVFASVLAVHLEYGKILLFKVLQSRFKLFWTPFTHNSPVISPE
jgi:hypothetical protein